MLLSFEKQMLIDPVDMVEKKQVKYGQFQLEYELIFEDRKNLAITVQPDKSIIVKAPEKSSIEEIQAKIQKRGKWILKQINYFDQFHPIQPEREYVSGETHYYLGRQYRLRIRKTDEDSVKLLGKFFMVGTINPRDRGRVKLLMRQWYADHAKLILDRRSLSYAEKIIGPGFKEIATKYKYLKRRWGVYSPERVITFNIELIKAPMDCIDYVIVHELCHVLHPNHDKAFYLLMGSIFPDWQNRKKRLELFGAK